jgi:hypothetical protein
MFLLKLKRKAGEKLFKFVPWVGRHIATQKHFHEDLLSKYNNGQKGIPTWRIGGAFCPLESSLRNSTEDTNKEEWAKSGVDKVTSKESL